MIDKNLVQFATVRQIEYLEAVEKYGSGRKAATALGVAKSVLNRSIGALHRKAARYGYSPDHNLTHPVAPGQMLRGASQLYRRGEPEPLLTWVKSSADQEAQEAMRREAYDAMAAELPRYDPIASPGETAPHLCNLYTLTDCHVGALAWGKETLGDDWDLAIAERTLVGCFEHMVSSAPQAKVALVNQLGDYLHYDGLTPTTPLHGNILDADGRFSKMVGVAIRILRRVVSFALNRHEQVVLLIAEGNHDMASSVWLRHMFKALYENEPRVKLIDSELPYYAYQHGRTMIGFHHGHLKKCDQLPILFAAQFPKMWGDTTKRVVHTGHMHHTEEKGHSGITVHQHPTLAARDAYSARGGYVSERQVTAITYHEQFGEVARTTVTPEMLAAAP